MTATETNAGKVTFLALPTPRLVFILLFRFPAFFGSFSLSPAERFGQALA